MLGWVEFNIFELSLPDITLNDGLELCFRVFWLLKYFGDSHVEWRLRLRSSVVSQIIFSLKTKDKAAAACGNTEDSTRSPGARIMQTI
jgi:hypothetical protein